jgi:hypothetical protein
MPASLKRYDFNTRHGGRQAADREAAIAECQRIAPHADLLGQDSSENVFRAALSYLGIDHLALDAAALPSYIRVTSRMGSERLAGMAMDAAASSGASADFAKRFPEAARIKFA